MGYFGNLSAALRASKSLARRAAGCAARVALPMLVCLGSPDAEAASVRGKITGHQHLRNPVWFEAKSPDRHGYSFREPVTTVPAQLRRLTPDATKEICVVAFGRAAGKPAPISVKVAGGRTDPVTMVVLPGTEIRFNNGDPFTHRLFGVELQTFPPAPMNKGASRRWTAKEAGTYEFRDELAPSIRSWIVAKPGVVAVAYPASDGDFELSLAAGDYELQAYFAGAPVGRSRAVKVARRPVNLTRKPLVVATKPRGGRGKK